MKDLLCDMHIHSQYSDGQLSIHQIIDLYGKSGFDVIAITDHYCEQKNFLGQVSRQLNLSLTPDNFTNYMQEIKFQAKRAWKEYRMLVLPGYEITKNSFHNDRSAHLLVIGTDQEISPDLPIQEILQQAHLENALTIAAHPFYTGEFEFQTFQLWSQREELKNLIDLWEVNIRQKINHEILTSGLPLVANSDFHRPQHMKSWKTKVFAEQNQESVFHSFRKQKIDFVI